MHAFKGLAPVRTQRRSLLSAFALLTICLIAAQPISLLASSRTIDSKKIATTSKLKASRTTVKVNKPVTFTVTVTPSKATGRVTLYAKAPGKHYVAELTRTLLGGMVKGSGEVSEPGTYEIKAVYDGSSKYAPSTSNVVKVKVVK
jgi:hypothetical protein